MEKTTVLICDDSPSIQESLSAYLRAEGYEVLSVYDGESALRVVNEYSIDLLILDVMLPRMFGTEVCKEIRKIGDMPIIMLSAKGDEADRIIGLEAGADDYIPKPFSPREVSLRVGRLLHRTAKRARSAEYTCGRLTIIPERYEVYIGSERIEMLPKEIELLGYFAQNVGKVLSREQLLNAVWGYSYYGDTRAVDTQVKRIRKRLPAENVGFVLRTVYGVGYKLEEIKNETEKQS